MNKEEITLVLQATLLLYDEMPEEEVKRLVGDKYLSCANYILGFIRSYKL